MTEMQLVGGIYVPAEERHLQRFLLDEATHIDGKGTYQLHKLRAALAYVQNHRAAIDIGAHVGLWSMQLVKHFGTVHAFEPLPSRWDCWEMNLQGHASAVLYGVAAGERAGSVGMQVGRESTGDSFIDGEGDYPVLPIDSFDLQDIDFIKADCEGYELAALRGAEATIRRCRPVIIVEQKPGRAQRYGYEETEAVTWLLEMGMQLRASISGDFILSWA